ncbi:MAG: DUF4041 domain-containing protein [Bdellovibrionaceae bacterium]|nr:DUF4041 domain-containing protein [Pseudobdellovibrionaceae bacterium]
MKASSELKKYRPLVDINKEIEVKGKQVADIKSKLEKLNISFESVKKEVQLLNDDHDLLSAGFYKSKYNFGDASKYEEKIDSIRTRQKELIKEKEAIICKTEWTVGGSKAEGKKMTDRIIKLGLSAFNVQCDNEILRVKFDNIDRAEEKMTKIRENVNKLLEPNQCEITEKFFKLKLEELFLAYEYQEQVQKEKEEQKQIREQMRDDEKARRELERVQAEAEREEKRYAQALEKARADLTQKSDAEKESFMLKIAALEDKLKEAHENKERAKSQAEMTKRGYVYVISNIGSFGENVYKIGMTRRLDPMDRVWELGDASVPFDFDVHAMIHSEDAPNLERRLHEAFNHRRVNQVNERKEFFRVPLSEIEQASRKIHNGEFKLTLLAEAKEYRQTVAMQNENIDKKAA